MNNLGCPFEVKELNDAGSFEGVASMYGNIDLGGDIVMPGAFKQFATTKDGSIRILDSHQTRSPIGKGKLTDTHFGLVLKGQLNREVARAREIHALMKDGIIDGLSVGFDILPNGAEVREDGVRLLKELKLWEVSTTAFPMNQSAQVSAVKTLEKINSVREMEDMLRDAVGLSRAQAKLHAGAIWSTLTGQRDADGEVGDAAKLAISTLEKYHS
jgi:HK97 family phage prohead protease